MANSEDRLRAEVKRLRRAVTRKVSRLKQTHDVFLSGTQFDPRRAPRSEAGFNASQLRSYMHELAAFVDRGNQFVGDAQKKPIPRSEWKQYKELEKEYNRRVNAYFDQYKDVQLPTPGKKTTVADRMRQVMPDHRQMGNPAVQAPFDPVEREPGNVASKSALEKLTDSMRKRLEGDYFERKLAEGADAYFKMIAVVNDKELEDAVKGLNNDQWALLWNYTEFATTISIPYEFALKALSDEGRAFHGDVAATHLRRAHELVEWVKGI